MSRLPLVFVEPEVFGGAAGFRAKQAKLTSSLHGTREEHLLVKSLTQAAWKRNMPLSRGI